MKITEKDRELAAHICGIAASNPEMHQSYGFVWSMLGRSRRTRDASVALGLAFNAWKTARYATHPDAEAEAMIRSGWSP